jgi:hypothetical protein
MRHISTVDEREDTLLFSGNQTASSANSVFSDFSEGHMN